jgi:Ca2+-binding RTX toxin-like protein
MSITAETANELLSGIDTAEKLRDLISQLDVTGSGDVTVLYSGGDSWEIVSTLVDQGENIRIVDRTEAADFLDIDTNDALLEKLDDIFPGSDPEERGSAANRFLFGDAEYENGERVPGTRQPNAAWDIVSQNFVEATSGEVRTLLDGSAYDGTFAQVEVPALLNNNSITRVEGIPLNELVDLNSHASVFVNLQTISDSNVLLSGMQGNYVASNYVVSVGDYLNPELLNTNLYLIEHPDKLQLLVDYYDSLEPEARLNHINRLEVLNNAAESLASRFDLYKVANRLGVVGSLLGFSLAASQASAAETEEESRSIMEGWAVDAAGSEIGAIAGTAVGTVAIGVAAAAGIAVSAPVAAVIIFGAGVVGSLFGADAATDFYESFGKLSERQQRYIVRRLGELFFGENEVLLAELPTDINEGQFLFERITGINDVTRDQIIEHARNSIAWRYALRELNPFVVEDAEYQEQHNSDHSLDLHNDENGEGFMTDEWLKQRSNFLIFERLYRATDDTDGVYEMPLGLPVPILGDIHFIDHVDGHSYELTVDGLDLGIIDAREILFGGDGDETFTGQDRDDIIFGGNGNDNLTGNAGNDYLEGNSGIDTLKGDSGDDALYGNNGNDILDGGTERDLLIGGTGADTLRGGDDHDFLMGGHHIYDEGSGYLHIFDDGESDRLEGGLGDELYYAGAGNVINDEDCKGSVCVNVTTGSGDQVYVMLGLNPLRQTGNANVCEEYNDFYDTFIATLLLSWVMQKNVQTARGFYSC